MKKKKTELKDLNRFFLNTVIVGLGLGIGFYVLDDLLSGFSNLSNISMKDLTEHRYEILDQLIAERYYSK